MTKDINTRWILMYKPIERMFKEYSSLTRFMYKNRREVDRAKDVLFRMKNLETLLMLYGIFSMLYEINLL